MVEIQRYRVIKFQDIIVVKYTFHLWECLIIFLNYYEWAVECANLVILSFDEIF